MRLAGGLAPRLGFLNVLWAGCRGLGRGWLVAERGEHGHSALSGINRADGPFPSHEMEVENPSRAVAAVTSVGEMVRTPSLSFIRGL